MLVVTMLQEQAILQDKVDQCATNFRREFSYLTLEFPRLHQILFF